MDHAESITITRDPDFPLPWGTPANAPTNEQTDECEEPVQNWRPHIFGEGEPE